MGVRGVLHLEIVLALRDVESKSRKQRQDVVAGCTCEHLLVSDTFGVEFSWEIVGYWSRGKGE